VIDLHTHSAFSDGSDSPADLAREAKRRGLSAIALTDHDTTASHEEMASACAALDLELVPGVEVSVRDTQFTKTRPDGSVEEGVGIHVLAYFLPLQADSPVQQLLAGLRRDRDDRNRRLVTLLNELGFTKLRFAHVVERARNEDSVGRPHFAAAMHELHPELVGPASAENTQALFRDWLGSDGKAYLKKSDLRLEDLVAACRGTGTVLSVAHPLLNYLGGYASVQDIHTKVPPLLASLRDRGVTGVEAYYGSTPAAIRDLMVRLTREAQMVPTVGSDYHGSYKADVALGVGRSGDLRVPDEVLVALKEASARLRDRV